MRSCPPVRTVSADDTQTLASASSITPTSGPPRSGKSSNAVWVNLYGASTLATTLADGTQIKLTQETEYPWNGRVRITINECGTTPFALKLRIPGWAKSASVRVNLSPVADTSDPGTYFELKRAWKSGDVVDLDIPMPVQLIEANPLVEETLGQVALKRGPVVYCLESTDLPAGTHVMNVSVPDDAKFLARYDQRLLGGVVTLDCELSASTGADWSGQLYREVKPAELKLVKARLIPYFVWGNRGKTEMSVWLRRQ